MRLKGKVVVITGASSGIGRATARRFAKEGCRLVLAARGAEALEAAAQECRRIGARVEALSVDVAQEAQVQALARRAIEAFGTIDVWVNDVGVCAFGAFLQVPSDAFRRVIETNFFGVTHGCRAALGYFKERGQGVLINVASVLGKEGIPYLSSYVASKEAVIGLSACLREELRDEKDIHVCTVLPSSIDTPIWQHGANYSGHAVKPPPPVYKPDDVARRIVRLAENPKRIVYAGRAGQAITALHKAAPGLYEAIAARVARALMLRPRAQPPRPGNLFEPEQEPMAVEGGWGAHGKTLDRVAALAMLAVGGVLAWKKLKGGPWPRL